MAEIKLTLEQRVQALPNELSDAILELVLVPDEPHPIINRDYKPPVQLQIDRHSRQKLAATYYEKVTFVGQKITMPVSQSRALPDVPQITRQFEDVVMPWIQALNLDHRQRLKHVRLKRDLCVDAYCGDVVEAFDELIIRLGLNLRSDLPLVNIACNLRHTPDGPEKWLRYPARYFRSYHSKGEESRRNDQS